MANYNFSYSVVISTKMPSASVFFIKIKKNRVRIALVLKVVCITNCTNYLTQRTQSSQRYLIINPLRTLRSPRENHLLCNLLHTFVVI